MRRSRLWVNLLFVAIVTCFAVHVSAEPVTIQVWGLLSSTDPQIRAVEEAILADFNKKYEGKIIAEATFISGAVSKDKLITSVAGGIGPDVSQIHRVNTGIFAANGVILPVTHLLERDGVNLGDFFGATWQELVYEEDLYGLPAWTDVRALWYNRNLLRESGVDPDVPAQTWDSIEAMSRKLTLGPPGEWHQIGFMPNWGNWYFPAWVWAAGGEIVSPDNRTITWNDEYGLMAAEWIDSFVRRQYGSMAQIEGWSRSNASHFENEKRAFAIDTSTWYTNRVDQYPNLDIGVTYIPRPEGLEHEPISWSGGYGWAVPNGANHVEEAWEFIKYVSSPEVQLRLAQSQGLLPSHIQAAQTFVMETGSPEWMFLANLMNYSRLRPVFPTVSEVWTVARNVGNMLRDDKGSPAAYLETTAREAQVILDTTWADFDS